MPCHTDNLSNSEANTCTRIVSLSNVLLVVRVGDTKGVSPLTLGVCVEGHGGLAYAPAASADAGALPPFSTSGAEETYSWLSSKPTLPLTNLRFGVGGAV